MSTEAPSLRTWYEENRRPEMAWRLSPATLRAFDRSIQTFDAFAGAGVRVNAINDAKLAEFVERRELGPRGRHTVRYRREMARCVRRIVRDFDPALLAASRDPHAPTGDGQTHLTLRGYVEEVYLPTALADSSDAHRANARSKIRQFDEFHGGDILLNELSDALLEAFLGSRVKNGRPVGTANHFRAIICAVWRHAYRVGFSPKPPRVKRLRDPRPAAELKSANDSGDRLLILPFPSLQPRGSDGLN